MNFRLFRGFWRVDMADWSNNKKNYFCSLSNKLKIFIDTIKPIITHFLYFQVSLISNVEVNHNIGIHTTKKVGN